jgi:hypothetical protein
MNYLNNFYLQLPAPKRKNFKQTVMQRTGWSNSTFYYKREHENVTKLEDEVINTILARFRYADREQERIAEKFYQRYHISQ